MQNPDDSFHAVVRVFSILLLFDANKLDISDEFKNAIEASAQTHPPAHLVTSSSNVPIVTCLSHLHYYLAAFVSLFSVCVATTTRSVWY